MKATLTTFAATEGRAQCAFGPAVRALGTSERFASSLRIGAGSAAASASSRVSQSNPGASARERPGAHRDALRMHRQPIVREAVLDRIELVADDDVGRDSAPCNVARRRRRDRSSGRLHRPGPDAERGTLLQEDGAGVFHEQHADLRATGRAFAGRGDGSAATRSVRSATQSAATGHSPQRGAARVQTIAPRSISPCVYDVDVLRAAAAIRRSTTASPRPSARPDSLRRRDGARARALRCLRGSRSRSPKANAAIAAAVERPTPGSVAMVGASRGNSSAMPRDDRARRFVQMMRTTVVAETAPELEHAIDGRFGQRGYVRKRREKSLVVRNDGRHLRLLQHDLGEPDAIRIVRALPREIVAAVRLPAR